MKADWLPLHKFWKQNELRAGTANSQVLGLFFFNCSCETQNPIRIFTKAIMDNLSENVDFEF